MAAPKRTGLGRGIGALIPVTDEGASRPVDVFFPSGGSDGSNSGTSNGGNGGTGATAAPVDRLVDVPGARLASIRLDDIVPNPRQPRTEFDADALEELVVSIRENGVLQPIVVRPAPAGSAAPYELVMGERRLRASKRAGLSSIPAVVRETEDDAMLQDALLENLNRAQLNPLEEASAYQQLLSDFGITHEQLATRIGRSRPQISNTIRLLKLPAPVANRVASGVLTAGHARAILSLADDEEMQRLADKIVNEDLSVRAAEAVASAKSPARRARALSGKRHEHLDEIAERLGDRLDTRVKIALGASKGQLVIDFATIADLNRILAELGDEGFSR
ncbi:MAG TPA: ParB/RepB/Spo0J family partition protein [Naasia sp.]|jgi:ParB family chromosome partitioning protein